MTSSLSSIGLSALGAAYAAMQTTSNNIANASVAGYSRQQTEQATRLGQFTGAGYFGSGVDVQTVTRAHDEFLTRASVAAGSLAAMDSARSSRLEQLESVFQTGESGIGYTTGQFLNAMVDLAARPADSATRQTVLARAQDLATRFTTASQQLDTLQSGIAEDLRSSVSQVNSLAARIAQANDQIAASQGLGQPANDLLDQRDQLLSQLGELVQVTTVPADDGSLGVFVAGGQSLVLGSRARTLEVGPDITDSSRVALFTNENGTRRPVDAQALGGGSIAGLLQFQNDDLVDARNLIGQLATAVAGVVNRQQQLGVSLQQPIGSVASQPLFATGAPVATPATTNARDAAGNYLSTVAMTVVEPTAVQAANYDLRADPAGSGLYQLTRLSEPPVTQLIAGGDVVDGIRFEVPSGLQAGDRFLLKPVAGAAGGMAALLGDWRDLAAASPLTASAGSANTGTGEVGALTMLAAPAHPDATANITFTDDAGAYQWQLVDGGGSVIASGSGTWSAGQTIPPDPLAGTGINGFALQLSGVPRSGDTFSVAPTPADYVASNNGNALAFAALRDTAFVGRTLTADGRLLGGSTATDAYASALADIGVRVQTATTSASISSAVADQAKAQALSVSGVDLDEEAARLIQYQQSYQAAAKVLQIAQSIFDTLLNTAAR